MTGELHVHVRPEHTLQSRSNAPFDAYFKYNVTTMATCKSTRPIADKSELVGQDVGVCVGVSESGCVYANICFVHFHLQPHSRPHILRYCMGSGNVVLLQALPEKPFCKHFK